jgi:hypothetical protein
LTRVEKSTRICFLTKHYNCIKLMFVLMMTMIMSLMRKSFCRSFLGWTRTKIRIKIQMNWKSHSIQSLLTTRLSLDWHSFRKVTHPVTNLSSLPLLMKKCHLIYTKIHSEVVHLRRFIKQAKWSRNLPQGIQYLATTIYLFPYILKIVI